MKKFIAKVLPCLLILITVQSYAQYSRKQIDSIYSEAQPDRDIASARLIYNASKVINYDKGIVEGLTLYAENSYALNLYESAFKYITQAEKEATKIKDPILTSKIMTYKGLCYYRLGFYREADQTLNNTIPITETISNKEDMHYYLAAIYTGLDIIHKDWDNKEVKDFWAKKAYAESEQLEKSNKYLWAAAITASNRGNRFTMRKQYDSAEFYLKKALRLTSAYNDESKLKKHRALWPTYLHAGDYYYAVKEFPQAAFYYKEAVNVANQLKYAKGLKSAYQRLSKVYSALNLTKEALKYAEKSRKLTDSLALVDKTAIKTPLDYIINSKEQVLAQNKQRYLQIIFVVSLFLLIVTGGVFFYRYKFNREIKLSAERISELIRKIEMNEDKSSPAKIEELKYIVQLAINNDPIFFVKYNEFDPQFCKKLLDLAPSLTAIELEYCLLFKLSFETKEIARYAKVSVRTVEGKKYRIRKKLNIPSNHDVSIWMNHI